MLLSRLTTRTIRRCTGCGTEDQATPTPNSTSSTPTASTSGEPGFWTAKEAAGFLRCDATKALWANWREQLAAWIRGQRNHPSLFVWSIENEITFINGHVRDRDTTPSRPTSITEARQSWQAADPTRPFMTDGGNALLDESLPGLRRSLSGPAVRRACRKGHSRISPVSRIGRVWPDHAAQAHPSGRDVLRSRCRAWRTSRQSAATRRLLVAPKRAPRSTASRECCRKDIAGTTSTSTCTFQTADWSPG